MDVPREKARILSDVSVPDGEIVEYKTVGSMSATAVMVIRDDKASAIACLKVIVSPPKYVPVNMHVPSPYLRVRRSIMKKSTSRLAHQENVRKYAANHYGLSHV
jgi:hypothetical protein